MEGKVNSIKISPKIDLQTVWVEVRKLQESCLNEEKSIVKTELLKEKAGEVGELIDLCIQYNYDSFEPEFIYLF